MSPQYSREAIQDVIESVDRWHHMKPSAAIPKIKAYMESIQETT